MPSTVYRFSQVISVGVVLTLLLMQHHAHGLTLSKRQQPKQLYAGSAAALETGLTPVSELQEREMKSPSYNTPDTGVEALHTLTQSKGPTAPKASRKVKRQTSRKMQTEIPVSIQPAVEGSDTLTPDLSDDTLPQTQALATAVDSMILVLPVMSYQSQNKAFADLPVMLSSAVANQLSQQASGTVKILNPIYAYDDIKERGLDGLYQRLIQDYLESGRPNDHAVKQLVQQLSTPTQALQHIVFVSANFDANAMSRSATLKERTMETLFGRTTQDPNYFLSSLAQAFSTQPGSPLVWQGRSSGRLKMTSFGNFTRSVYDEPDSASRFEQTAQQMAGKLSTGLLGAVSPPQLQVQGRLVGSTSASNPAQQALNLTPSDQAALKRILENP